MPNFVFVKETCAVLWKTGTVRLERGAAWPANDPFVKARPEFFDAEPTNVHRSTPEKRERPVEDATAEPGKKRSTK